MKDAKTPIYWQQSLQDHLLETSLLVLTLLFLVYVVKLAFFEGDEDEHQD